MVENKRSKQIPNSLISVIDTLEQRPLAVIRFMLLNHAAHDLRTIYGTAKPAPSYLCFSQCAGSFF